MLDTGRDGFGRAFQVIWLFYFLSFVVSYALLPTIPLHLRGLGATVKESGRFTLTFMVGAGVGALFTGPLGDRMGQRKVLTWACMAAGACFAIYAFSDRVWQFFLVGVPHGVVWSGFRTATLAWVGGFLPPERRAEGFAIFGMAAPGGAALGPVVGIWLMNRLDFPMTMRLMSAISVCLLMVLAFLPNRSEAGAQPGPSENPAKKHDSSWILAPAVLLTCIAMAYGSLPSYGAQEAADMGFAWPSALVSCYGMGMVALRAALGWFGMGKDPMRLLPWMLASIALGSLGLATLPWGLARHIVCGAVFGASFGMSHTLVWSNALGRAEAGRRGAATGLLYFAYDVGIGIGSLAIGFPMEYLGYRHGWAACAIFPCIAILVAMRTSATGATPQVAAGTRHHGIGVRAPST